MSVAVNNFVRRQIKGSGKTYSLTLSFEEIARHADEQMERGEFSTGYRDGVRIVQADQEIISQFICPFVQISEETELEAQVVKRQENEESYIQVRAINGDPLPAGSVEFICYRHDVLNENNENSTDAEWEMISIHAIPIGVKELPMGPVTMMRNQLQLNGGTKAHYNSETCSKSVQFWQKIAPLKDC